jgi:hypothetical protein
MNSKRYPTPLSQDVFNLPNVLTMGRVAIIPLVLWLLNRGSP